MIILLFISTIAIALLAQWHVKRMYHRYSRVPAAAGYTGAEVARQLLRTAGISDVSIHEHEEMLGDHYDPMRKRLVLSSANYHGTSLAAIGVAAHECGHAIQHQQAYAPLHLRMAAVSATSFASQIVLWLPLLGIMTGILATHVGLLIMAVAWGVIMAFNLVTLPVEFDASRRAKVMLGEMGFMQSGAEREGVSRVLNAAGWTYVAAFITSLIYFLWHLLPLLTGRDRD
ncbi:MAG: zinc metallopeptidase [Verrucomicrobia bacterium]|nr:zinc metallopeptidase [Verrucomicrobiota bacterium]